MTVSSNLKTRVQNKINAVTGSTALTELLKLKKAAEGLGCDETALETQLQARLTAMGAGTESTDLLIGSKTSGLAGRSYYTAPFAVNAGDILYVDQLGGVRKNKHTCAGLVSTASMNSAVATKASAQESMLCGNYSNVNAFFKLQDGNWLVVTGNIAAGGSVDLAFYIISSDFSTIFNRTQVGSLYSDSNSANHEYIGLYQTAANTFRLYFLTPANNSTSDKTVLCYMAFTYSAGAKNVSVSSQGTYLWPVPTSYATSRAGSISQGDRYVPFMIGVNTSNYQHYVLDMLNGTLQQVTGLTSSLGSMEWLQFDHFSAGNEFGIVRYSGGRKIYKGSTAALTDLPANVTALFNGTGVRLIAAGTYLINDTTGNLTLVKFDAAYSSASFWAVGKIPSVVTANTPSVVTDGTRYWVSVGTTSPVCSFCWDGANAPHSFTIETEFKAQDRAALTFRGKPLIGPNDMLAWVAAVFRDASSNYRHALYFFQPCEFMPHKQTPFGVCMTSAAQGSVVEIELMEGSEQAAAAPSFNAIGYRHHQGVLTKLVLKDEQLDVKTGAARGNTTPTETTVGPAIVYSEVAAKVGQRGVSAGNYAAVLSSPNSEIAGTCSNASSINNDVHLLSPIGVFYYPISYDGSTGHTGGAFVRTHSPVMLCFRSNSTNLIEGAL